MNTQETNETPTVDWYTVYDLSKDDEIIAAMQKVSLDETDEHGLSPSPYLVGSPQWWDAIRRDKEAATYVGGKISRVMWTGMGDYAEFEIRDSSDNCSTWTREGDARRYVPGLQARLEYVEHGRKKPDRLLGARSKLILTIRIEESAARVSGIGPGPGGAGYRYAGGRGALVHYLIFPSEDLAHHFEKKIRPTPITSTVYLLESVGLWMITFSEGGNGTEEIKARCIRVADQGKKYQATYDGCEIVGEEGQVYGPDFIKEG